MTCHLKPILCIGSKLSSPLGLEFTMMLKTLILTQNQVSRISVESLLVLYLYGVYNVKNTD